MPVFKLDKTGPDLSNATIFLYNGGVHTEEPKLAGILFAHWLAGRARMASRVLHLWPPKDDEPLEGGLSQNRKLNTAPDFSSSPCSTFIKPKEDTEMPEISRFYGIIITMFFCDHNPPHFHARYGGEKVAVEIESLRILEGHLSPRALGLVMEWAFQHRQELLQNWGLVNDNKAPKRIEPLK